MIGIVAVSHSHALATAAVTLATEMLHGQPVRLEVAAGLDEHTLGTDAVAVSAAIAAADTGDGVLVLMDLGSAVLSAELAVDLLTAPHRVHLCPAPFVEGLIAAAVAAAGGANLDEAAYEARNALSGKQSHFHDTEESAQPVQATTDPTTTATFVVTNEHGLHARPAARLIAEIRDTTATVRLRNLTTGAGPVPGTSPSRLATLGARSGHEIEVTASGPGASEAVSRVLDLAARRFDETPASDSAEKDTTDRDIGPLPASPGIGTGPVRHLGSAELVVPDRPAGAPETESALIETALATVRADIRRIRAHAGKEADIFDTHLLLLDDEELIGAVRRAIAVGNSAPTAWTRTLESAAAELDRLPDDYQRARAGDLRAIRDQVLAAMLGRSTATVSRPGVLVAADLTPAQAATLDPEVVTGIVLAQGSPTSHSMILVRSRGIPAVVGTGTRVLTIPEGTVVALDGTAGRLVVDPDPATLADFTEAATRHREQRHAAEVAADEPAITRDGVTVHIAANVGSVADATESACHGADLAGLVRTEFLFLGRDDAPSVDEQERAYRSVAEAFAGRRVVLRTLDVGGDKPLPYIAQPPEDNPYLGVRGIRLALARPELLRDQLAAICRVAADHPVGVMFPMVTRLDELLEARRILDEVAAPDATPEVGIMVEVPTVAAKAAVFAEHVDFFSVGTNDLTQYTLAAERGNTALGDLADPLDPGVLRLIAMLCEEAGTTRVAVCGEAAADPVAAALLLGLGVRELSVAPPAIPLVKAAVRNLDLNECHKMAIAALHCASAGEVRALAGTETS